MKNSKESKPLTKVPPISSNERQAYDNFLEPGFSKKGFFKAVKHDLVAKLKKNAHLHKYLNAKQEKGDEEPAINLAAKKGHHKMVKLLLKAGADIEATNNQGSTALHWAAHRGHADIVDLLLHYGAKIEARSNSGKTPLHRALLYSPNEETIQLLLGHGANPNAVDDEGNCPLKIAIDKENPKLVKILRAHAALSIDQHNLLEYFSSSIGHSIKNKNLFIQALTRKSAVNEGKIEPEIGHNERLEFLGDGILRMVVDDILIELYPYKQEDFLTEERNKLVSKEGLFTVAKKLALRKFINLGEGEAINYHNGGAKKILSDTLEAIFGAIFLDSNRNYAIIKNFIAKQLALDIKLQAHRDKELLAAVKEHNLIKVNYWLKQGANPNCLFNYRYKVYTPWAWSKTFFKEQATVLELAICEDAPFGLLRLNIIKSLLSYKANPNVYTIMQLPVLSFAIYLSNVHYNFSFRKDWYKWEGNVMFYNAVIKLLLNYNADLSLEEVYGTAPIEAASAATAPFFNTSQPKL